MRKTVIAIAVFLLVTVLANPLQERTAIEVIKLEEQCVQQGGLCLRIDDCEPGNLVNLGVNLCPLQRHRGVSCCYV